MQLDDGKEPVKKETYVKEALCNLFFPRRCPICDVVVVHGRDICKECEERVPLIGEPVCKRCGKPLTDERSELCGDCSRKRHYFKQGKAVFLYQKGMKQSMYRFKYAGRREYATYYARVAAENYGVWIKRHGIGLIVPVPMYLPKKRKRGYNQAEVFARSLGAELELPVGAKIIRRVKNTVPQKALNDRQRKDNVKGAFQLDANIVEYSKILLVDDIYTTGSTIDAVAECFLEAGVEEVYFLTACIGEGC